MPSLIRSCWAAHDRSVRVGTAGWSIPRNVADHFSNGSSALARYSSRFDCVEINSSFHRRHRFSTWERWADTVHGDFRFSVKTPKTVTHELRLKNCSAELREFATDVAGLGEKLGAVLVQLPPSLHFEHTTANSFFSTLRQLIDAPIVCEPRHASWFEEVAEECLVATHISRIAADPAKAPAGGVPGGWRGLAYWRLHGSPNVYRSSYGTAQIASYADAIKEEGRPSWCVFDNTAASFATANALALQAELRSKSQELDNC